MRLEAGDESVESQMFSVSTKPQTALAKGWAAVKWVLRNNPDGENLTVNTKRTTHD